MMSSLTVGNIDNILEFELNLNSMRVNHIGTTIVILKKMEMLRMILSSGPIRHTVM